MSTYLTPDQLVQLEAALVQRQQVLDQRLADRTQGLSRAEHAHEVLLQNDDDVPQRENLREMDLARVDIETQELAAVSAALRRLHGPDYGACSDCAGDIPFERLKVEPWALRCVACEGRRERVSRS